MSSPPPFLYARHWEGFEEAETWDEDSSQYILTKWN